MSKKINSIRPNSLSLGALEVVADRTGDPVLHCSCSEGLEGPQHMQSPYLLTLLCCNHSQTKALDAWKTFIMCRFNRCCLIVISFNLNK